MTTSPKGFDLEKQSGRCDYASVGLRKNVAIFLVHSFTGLAPKRASMIDATHSGTFSTLQLAPAQEKSDLFLIRFQLQFPVQVVVLRHKSL